MELIRSEQDLDELLTRPGKTLVDFMHTLESPLVVLGAGGKMGFTLAVLAKRAAMASGSKTEVIAVSRFADSGKRQKFEEHGVKTIGLDLLARERLGELPGAENIIYMAGVKFGTTENPELTRAINTVAPAHVVERYASSRVVALSTGNVYPLVPVKSGGATETHPPGPAGEYGETAVQRESIFREAARESGMRAALLRLNYAVELRYGVLADIAAKVWNGDPVDLTNGWFNCIWQGDACDYSLRALSLAGSPATVWNMTGLETHSVRAIATQFGELMDRSPRFVGQEEDTALLSNSRPLFARLGMPPTPFDDMIRWTADWVRSGGRSLNKPTHFEVRDGKF